MWTLLEIKKKYMTNAMYYRLYLFGSTKIWFAVDGIYTWSLLITLLDVGSFVELYTWKSELHGSFQWMSLISSLRNLSNGLGDGTRPQTDRCGLNVRHLLFAL